MNVEFKAHDDYLLKCVFSPNMKVLCTTSSDHTIKIWDCDCLEAPPISTLAHHQKWVWDGAFSSDSNYLVSASSDQSAKLWDLRTNEVIRNFIGHQLAVTCVALSDAV